MTTVDSAISEIMLNWENGLPVITPDDSFAKVCMEIFFRGKRHLCVVNKDSRDCYRVISRRDFLELSPPGGNILPQELQEQADIDSIAEKIDKIFEELSDQKVGDLFKPQVPISIGEKDPILMAIQRLSEHQLVNGMSIRIGCLPVLDHNSKLVGFVSYETILEFIKHQDHSDPSFLGKTFRSVATTDNVKKLNQNRSLVDAYALYKNRGIRSIPIVDDDENLVGFVEDVQIRAYSHKNLSELDDLKIRYFMTPVDNLFTPMGGEILRSAPMRGESPKHGIIDHFLHFPCGFYQFPPSSFVICDSRETQHKKKIEGIVSYIDILKAYRKHVALKNSLRDESSSDAPVSAEE